MRSAAAPLPSPPRVTAIAAADDITKMKVLFKSKSRTPTDVVRQMRELLIYVDLHSGSRRQAGGEGEIESDRSSYFDPTSLPSDLTWIAHESGNHLSLA